MLLLSLLAACGPGTVGIQDGTDPTTPSSGYTTTRPPGTGGGPGTGTGAGTGTAPTGDAPDYRLRGPATVGRGQRDIVAESCTMAVSTWLPEPASSQALVVLSHGFMRQPRHVAGLAEHLASWGVPVATPGLCHATAFDTDHPQNGRDLAAMAEALAPGNPVLYAGHSAGGLASVLAAAVDTDTVSVLGLDPVEFDTLGADAAAGLGVPVFGLLGDPSACNDQASGARIVQAAAEARLLDVPGSTHCQFESPTDSGCTLFCGAQPADADAMTAAIQGILVAWALLHDGDPRAEQWWTPGELWFDQLVAEGTITPR